MPTYEAVHACVRAACYERKRRGAGDDGVVVADEMQCWSLDLRRVERFVEGVAHAEAAAEDAEF